MANAPRQIVDADRLRITVRFAVLTAVPIAIIASQEAPRRLSLGESVERDIAGGQVHAYRLALRANQYMHLVVEQRGIDVQLTLYGPDRTLLHRVDSPSAPSVWSVEACDGVDNNFSGQADEYLYFCLNGKPALNTDGRLCLTGYSDQNLTASDGCEYRGTLEQATRVIAVAASAQRLDGGSATRQVLMLRPGMRDVLTFSVYTFDGYKDIMILRPVLVTTTLPECPNVVFEADSAELKLTISVPQTAVQGSECQVTRAYASSRTPNIVASLSFTTRVGPPR